MMKQRSKVMEAGSQMFRTRCSDEECVDDIALRPRPAEHCIEAQVQPDDTLQAIALRFHCQISELKRINHIHKDNEIFARRIIKVPVTPFSILTETLPAVPEPKQHKAPQVIRKPEHIIDYNAAILNSSIVPSIVPYTDAEETTDNTPLIAPKPEPVETIVVKELTSQGADFGLKWWHMVLFAVIVGVVVPLLYLFLYVEQHSAAVHELFDHRIHRP